MLANTPPPSPEAIRPDTRLLAILVCPVTRTALTYDAKKQELVSTAAGLAFPIRQGIPIMLPEAARKLT